MLCYPFLTPAQISSAFIKGDFHQCWLDVKDIVHRHGTSVEEHEKDGIVRAKHYTSVSGTLATIQVQIIPSKDKEGREGCFIIVTGIGPDVESLDIENQMADQAHGRFNFRVADLIKSEVESMKKAREKKAKKNP
jgi:hypothetical protein